MDFAGRLGRLFFAQGLLGLVLAFLAHAQQRPVAVWVLAFAGVVLLSTGVVLWATASEAETQAMRDAVARGDRRFDGRPGPGPGQ
jgi:uncharacterized membrane protein